jgi:8-hydroxy-5-deazaflavin:NADPH oxidoreductase
MAKSKIVFLAVPFGALDDVVRTAGEALAGKMVVDVTNALDANMSLALGFTTSGAEELQKKLPRARVVEAFQTVFAQHMDTGKRPAPDDFRGQRRRGRQVERARPRA